MFVSLHLLWRARAPFWASSTEGVFCSFHCICCGVLEHLFGLVPLRVCFVRFIAFAVACSSTFFAPADFALRASRVFSYVRKLLLYISLVQLCLVGRWVGLVSLHPCADVLGDSRCNVHPPCVVKYVLLYTS